MEQFLSTVWKTEELFDISSAVDKYQALLQSQCLIANSFGGIKKKEETLVRKKKWIQFAIIFSYFIIGVRYTFLSAILLLGVEKMHYYQYLNFDYMEQLGILGRTSNVIYAIAISPIYLDKILLRVFESRGSLAFLTELTSLQSNKAAGGLTIEEKKQLAVIMHFKLYLCKVAIFVVGLTLHVLQIVGCILFITRITQSWTISLAAISYCCYINFMDNLSVGHIFGTALLTHVTTSYFLLRIKFVIANIKELTIDLSEESLSKVMNQYDRLVSDIRKHNRSLRYLIRNMVYGYCPLASVVIYLFTVDTNVWLKLLVICAASCFILVVFITEVFIGHFHSKLLSVYKELNYIFPKVRLMGRQISLDTLLRLQTAIKELGSERKDGQFTIGLTNGEGASLTTIQAVELITTTLGLTILIIKNF